MYNAQLRFIFDRYKKANNSTSKGILQIEVRLTGTNIRKLISTGIHLYKNQFSDKNGFTCKNHDNAPAITGKAARQFREIEAFVLSDKCKTLDDVKYWNREDGITTSVIEFMYSELRRNDPSADVLRYHNSLIKRLNEFGKIQTFGDITYENIVDFDAYLRKHIKSQPTLYKRHSVFHRYIKEAIKRGLCKFDPYLQFKVKRGKSKEPVFLIEDEIKKIMTCEPVGNRMEYIKDLFVFQIFTGMAFVDMQNFSREVVFEAEGKKVIKSSRSKTDESFISLLLPEAEAIAEKYDYELPKISNQKYNDYLKLLAVAAGIKKNLTSHVARHTFATYLLNKDIPIETVSRALGHAGLKMTQHYAKMLGKKVISDMSKLLEK
jgi:site-specific recombinase XerD